MNDEQERPPLPEAPASANLTVEYRGYNIQITIRDYSVLDLVSKFDPLIKALEKRGAKPAAPRSFGGGARKPSGPTVPVPTDGSAPICSAHNVPMTKGQYGWYCKRRDDNGEWCKVKAK